MEPTKIAGANLKLGPPVNWDDSECDALHVRKCIEPLSGTQVMQSAWNPTEQERAMIAAGAPIILTVWSTDHPPVSLHVE